MKKLLLAALLGLAILATSGGVALAAPLDSITQVMGGVYDDGYTVVITFNGANPRELDGAHGLTVYLMKKKREWQKQFPMKKIVSMAVLPGWNVGVTRPEGLLIHYEQK